MTEARNYIGDEIENEIVKFHNHQAMIFTEIPGIIESYDPKTNTCSVQPAIMAVEFDDLGMASDNALPLCVDVPVYFPGGGGCHLTFAVQKGDECIIKFQQRCIDAWHQSGGVQPQHVLRMHDLSDAIVQVGLMSQPNVIPAISLDSAQLRSDDGKSYVEINPTTHEINAVTPTNINCMAGEDITATAQNNIHATATTGNITANAGLEIDAQAGTHINAQAGANINATAGANITANAAGNITASAGANVAISGGGTTSVYSSGALTIQSAGSERIVNGNGDAHITGNDLITVDNAYKVISGDRMTMAAHGEFDLSSDSSVIINGTALCVITGSSINLNGNVNISGVLRVGGVTVSVP